MSIYKRKGSEFWYIQFTGPEGGRVQVSAGTTDRREAERLEAKLKLDAWEQRKKLKAGRGRVWQDAVNRWLDEKEGIKKSIERDKLDFRWLDAHLNGMRLEDIDRHTINEIARLKRAEGVAPATVNRMLALLRAVLRRACTEWEWLESAPTVRMLPNKARRVRYLTKEESARLMESLPPHLLPVVRFSLATGLRRRNVFDLKWANVDLDRSCCWVWGDEAKGRRAIAVPLNQDAVSVIRGERGKHSEFVFTYQGRPWKFGPKWSWHAALERAGIKDFRWHDLRHTWASWHIQAGTPEHVLQELGGWQSPEMVKRYAHLSPDHLASWAGNIEAPPRLRLVSSK